MSISNLTYNEKIVLFASVYLDDNEFKKCNLPLYKIAESRNLFEKIKEFRKNLVSQISGSSDDWFTEDKIIRVGSGYLTDIDFKENSPEVYQLACEQNLLYSIDKARRIHNVLHII